MTQQPKTRAPRFRAEKLRTLLEEAKAVGGQVNVNLRTGDATVNFPVDGKPVDNEEAARLEAAMNEAIPSARKKRA